MHFKIGTRQMKFTGTDLLTMFYSLHWLDYGARLPGSLVPTMTARRHAQLNNGHDYKRLDMKVNDAPSRKEKNTIAIGVYQTFRCMAQELAVCYGV